MEKIESMINWKTKALKIVNEEMKKIPEWLQDLSYIFDKFPEEKLLSERPEMNTIHYLTYSGETIRSSVNLEILEQNDAKEMDKS